MKKILLAIAVIALSALMIGSVYAISIPDAPTNCPTSCPGLTPGFWKHNLEVYLDLTNGAYSAAYGDKLDTSQMNGLLDSLRTPFGVPLSMTNMEFAQFLLDALNEPGWSADRTNVANWFNYLMGFYIF